MHEVEEREPMPVGSKGRSMKAAFALTAGALLVAGFTVAPANAAVTNASKASSIDAVSPAFVSNCVTGANNTVEYTGWCNGTVPTSYRVIADCSNSDWVLGAELVDGMQKSEADCQTADSGSLLTENWGYLLCSTNSGTGTYTGYINRHGDISQLLMSWGGNNITTGGTDLCDYDTSGEIAVPNSP